MRFLCTALLFAGLLTACDTQEPLDPRELYEDFKQDAPPLELQIETVGPATPARDTLRVRLTGLNTNETLWVREARIDGERVDVVRTRIDARTVEVATYVSERNGSVRLEVDADDDLRGVLGSDTLYVDREASIALEVEIERTFTRRLVTGTSGYQSDVSDVFHDTEGNIWVRLDGYRASFWSSPDGTGFTRHRSGFEFFLGVEDNMAWIESTQTLNSIYLERVDLTTGASVESRRVYYDVRLHDGDSHDGAFYGISGNRRSVMHVGDEYVEWAEGTPYFLQASGYSLLDYLIAPDGTHWLATVGRGVLRNMGAGWDETPGLAGTDAISLVEGPGGSVWSLVSATPRCIVQEWESGTWNEREVFERDGNGHCGIFTVGATRSVWRGTTDGWITRRKDGVVDRRYRSESVTSMGRNGRTLWVGTGYGLKEILDHENEGS